MFDCHDPEEAKEMLAACYVWAGEVKAENMLKWIRSIRHQQRFWNYFEGQ